MNSAHKILQKFVNTLKRTCCNVLNFAKTPKIYICLHRTRAKLLYSDFAQFDKVLKYVREEHFSIVFK